jgi:3-deoxy-D-manno-octulosonic-acid transferase
MLGVLYNALWYPALPFALIASGGLSPSVRRERLGAVCPTPAGADGGRLRIWMHASSVGEVEALRAIALGLIGDPALDARAVITTMTEAGRAAARRHIPGALAYALSPLDCAPVVRGFLAAVRPQLVLIAETELWPNYFIEAHRAGARVAMVNGRISERSFRRYRWARGLFAEALGCADLVLAQTGDDARRYVALGAPPEHVVVTGNTKFSPGAGAPALRSELEAFAAGRTILVAGSTAPGEERIVLDAYRGLRSRFPKLALVLAPRHLERAAEVEDELQQTALPYVKASATGLSETGNGGAASVLLLDTMGELRALYRRAAIAFVGGSIAPGRGGQNPAEPAEAAVPVLFGPHHENQREIACELIQSGGGRVVRDAREIERACAQLLSDENARRAAGLSARSSVERLSGGATAALAHLKSLVNPR